VEEPQQRLPRDAIGYWRLVGAGQGAMLLVGAIVIAQWVPWWIPVAVALVAAVVLAGVVPTLRWRRWRYEVRSEEVDLVRGTFVVRRTIIPIRRVQHVDTESGPLQDSYGLATVTFHTAAGGVAIPALRKGEAESVRTRVAELARTRDDT
jgi:membrane protein YdbS with pleckstrin-like domain